MSARHRGAAYMPHMATLLPMPQSVGLMVIETFTTWILSSSHYPLEHLTSSAPLAQAPPNNSPWR